MKMINFFKLDRSRIYSEKGIEEDKAFFQERKRSLYGNILFLYEHQKEEFDYEEKEANKYIRDKFKNETNKFKKEYLCNYINGYILYRFGVSYLLFDQNQKDELFKSDLSYESIKKISYDVTENNIKDCKKELPESVHECFNDYCFLMFCQTKKNPKINKSNFLLRIRDYFILDKDKDDFEGIRNETTYENIKTNMKNIYGELKEEYGMNIYYEKFLSYISDDTDYNYYETTKLLNEYYKNKKINKNNNIKDYTLIKQKEE